MGRKRKQNNTLERNWHLLDAKGKILGRLATEVARILQGKNKVEYVPYLDLGDNVVIINAKDIQVTGKKRQQKMYTFYSGYPSGLKTIAFEDLQSQKPEEVIRMAVRGMLPKNKLARQMIKKLYIYPKEDHPYKDKLSLESVKES